MGGHCIPIYPQFYIFNDPAATIPIAARSANKAMPPYAVDLLEAAVGDLGGHDVVVLGAAYRGGVKETAFSGAHDLVAELAARGARPLVHDPLFSDDELRAIGFEPVAADVAPIGSIVQAEHDAYRDLASLNIGVGVVVIDGRNWVRGVPAGTRRVTIGRGARVDASREAAGSLGSVA